MSFIISNHTIRETKFKNSIKLNEYYTLYTNKFCEILENSTKKTYLIGKIFGYYKSDKFIKSNIENIPKVFKKFSNIRENIDGKFCFFQSNNKILNFQTDRSAIEDIFYINQNGKIIISDNLYLIKNFYKKKLSLDNYSIMHSLINISKRPPINDTFFKEIKRFSFDQNIFLKKREIILKKNFFSPSKIKNPKKEEVFLNQYNKYLVDYSNIGNFKNKALFMSSGWDSTIILKLLIDKFGNNKVKPIIARLKFSKRTGIFNKFEIEKARNICKKFNVKLTIIDVDYSKINKYLDYSKRVFATKMLTPTFAYFLHYRLIEEGFKKFGPCDFFSGEISDGVHNFGFSQYLTLTDDKNNGYREYADKMMCYLFGPTFFNKIIDGTFKDDTTFKLLKNKLRIKSINNIKGFKNIFNNIMQSMFAINQRFPLNNEISQFLVPKKKKMYLKKFNERYLDNLDFTESDQLYSSYIYLYKKFHWQGSTVRPAYHLANDFNCDFINLFLNKNTQELLSNMPEHYGRGLEMKPVKFPIKSYLKKKIDIDNLNIGPHSYISDIDTHSDPYFEIIYHSKMRLVIKKTFEKYNPIKILDKNYFDKKYIKKILQSFNRKNDKVSAENIYSLFCICRFLKDIKF